MLHHGINAIEIAGYSEDRKKRVQNQGVSDAERGEHQKLGG